MSDCGARVVLLLASLVLAPFAWFSAMAVGNDWRMASLAGTVTSVILAVVIWRKYVRWTVLRSSSSLAVVLLVVAQVFLWRPLWAIGGCGMDDALRTAQSLAAMGLGLIALIFLWWGGFLWKHTRRSVANSILRRLRMTPNAVRLTVGIALVPLLPGLFFIGVYALQDFGLSWPEDVYICLCYEACAILAVIVWWLLWRPVVEWNRRRRVLTGLLAVAFLASPGAVLLRQLPSVGDAWDIICALAPVLASAVWLGGTAWAWRRTGPSRDLAFAGGDDAVDALARCPRCDYSLKGLHEVRCPECGWSATVDELVACTLAGLAPGP